MDFPASPFKANRNSAMIWGHWKIYIAILIKVLNIPYDSKSIEEEVKIIQEITI